jgi:putative ABC transport system permease protein
MTTFIESDRIYRLRADIKTPTEVLKAGESIRADVPHLEADFPEIESAIRVSGGSFLVRKGDIKFQEENTKFADSAFFHVLILK